jgi:hypothetical protein
MEVRLLADIQLCSFVIEVENKPRLVTLGIDDDELKSP